MQNEELVSIITPVYNCEELVSKTIESVLNQTYQNWEMILVDDCTPDHSAEVIKKYQVKDDRIKYIKLDHNSGAAIARNVALKNSNGRFVAYLDADDLWKSDKLEKQVKYMQTKLEEAQRKLILKEQISVELVLWRSSKQDSKDSEFSSTSTQEAEEAILFEFQILDEWDQLLTLAEVELAMLITESLNPIQKG